MSDLSATVTDTLVNAYTDYAGRVRKWSESLSDEQFWTKPYPYGNSYGHLVLHLTGNLNHYIGAQIAGTGYVRDREREFTEPLRPSKETVLDSFDDAVEMVLATLRAQALEAWSAEYQAPGEQVGDRLSIFLRCAAHIHHHVGQMIYLEKELRRSVS